MSWRRQNGLRKRNSISKRFKYDITDRVFVVKKSRWTIIKRDLRIMKIMILKKLLGSELVEYHYKKKYGRL